MSAHIVYSDKLGERVDQWGVKFGLNFGGKKIKKRNSRSERRKIFLTSKGT